MKIPTKTPNEAERIAEIIDKAWEEAGWDGANRPTVSQDSDDPFDDIWENTGWDGANR